MNNNENAVTDTAGTVPNSATLVTGMDTDRKLITGLPDSLPQQQDNDPGKAGFASVGWLDNKTGTAAVTDPVVKQDLLHNKAADWHTSASYLNRFSSPRIKRGMQVWEELSICVPAFMEHYVLRYASEQLISARSAAGTTDGLVTLHLLFDRTSHRRAICKLLDMVLEAEEGLLDEHEFVIPDPPGAGPDTEDDWMDEDGSIDYDCSLSGVPPVYNDYSHQLPQVNAPAYTNLALQVLGIT